MAAGPRTILEQLRRDLWLVTEGEMTLRQFRERYVFAMGHARGADYIGHLLDGYPVSTTTAWSLLRDLLELTEKFEGAFQGRKDYDTFRAAYDGDMAAKLFECIKNTCDICTAYSESGTYEEIAQRHLAARG